MVCHIDISDKRLRSVDGLSVTGAGQLRQWPIASNVLKLTPTWPENLFWTAPYPVKPGKLGRGRAEDSVPGPNNSPIKNTVPPSRKLKGWTGK